MKMPLDIKQQIQSRANTKEQVPVTSGSLMYTHVTDVLSKLPPKAMKKIPEEDSDLVRAEQHVQADKNQKLNLL